MPRAETRITPKGQARGEAAAQQEFIAATEPAPEAQPSEPAALEVNPLVPEAIPELFEEDFEAEPEDEVPNVVGLEDGEKLVLDDFLLGPSERPEESVLSGIPGLAGTAPRVSEFLDSLVAKGFSYPDVTGLATLSRNLGL